VLYWCAPSDAVGHFLATLSGEYLLSRATFADVWPSIRCKASTFTPALTRVMRNWIARSDEIFGLRRTTAAVVAGLFVVTMDWGSAATAKSAVECDDHEGPNPAAPEFYQERYNASVAEPLTKDLATFRDAVPSRDPRQIGPAAETLRSDISLYNTMFGTQTLFGCYSPAVLASLQQATDTLAPTFNTIVSAAASSDDKTPSDISGFVSRALPQEMGYIQALNAYAFQFGGQQVPLT
jgi:hypothetical protein